MNLDGRIIFLSVSEYHDTGSWYETIRYDIGLLTCAQDLSKIQFNLPHRTHGIKKRTSGQRTLTKRRIACRTIIIRPKRSIASGESWKYSAGQNMVFARSAITPPKVNTVTTLSEAGPGTFWARSAQ